MQATLRKGWFLALVALMQGAAIVGSPAGILDHWSTNQVSTNFFLLDFVVYANNRFVAFGEYSDYGALMSSEDGMHWVTRKIGGYTGTQSSGGLSWSTSLVYAGGKFLAFGGMGVSAVSQDGLYWQEFTLWGEVEDAAYNGTSFVATRSGIYYGLPDGVVQSGEGTTWGQSQSQVLGQLGGIAFGAGRFVAIGVGTNSGRTYTSGAGTTWVQRSIPGGSKISFCNNLFLVPFGAGTNLVSTNGIAWAMLPTGLTNELERVDYSRGTFLAVANGYLTASADGTNWFQYPKRLPTWTTVVATDGIRLVMVGGEYASGVRYNGFVYYTDPLVSLAITNTSPPQLVLSGLVGRSYQIQWTDDPLSGKALNWQTGTTVQLITDPFLWTDPTAANSPKRFYRAVLLP